MGKLVCYKICWSQQFYMKFILSLKPWMLFSLVIGPFFLANAFPEVMLIQSAPTFIFAWWIFAIGKYGYQKALALGLKVGNIMFFSINICLVPILFLVLGLAIEKERHLGHWLNSEILPLVMIPLSLYMVFAMVQTGIFASKAIAILEYRRKVGFSDYSGNYFLMLCFAIGVWVLQPKITRLIIEENTRNEW